MPHKIPAAPAPQPCGGQLGSGTLVATDYGLKAGVGGEWKGDSRDCFPRCYAVIVGVGEQLDRSLDSKWQPQLASRPVSYHSINLVTPCMPQDS